MTERRDDFNNVRISGKITGMAAADFAPGKTIITLDCMRLSGRADRLPVLVDSRQAQGLQQGLRIEAAGRIRTANVDSRVLTMVEAEGLYLREGPGDVNMAAISGTICKAPVYRETPMGKELCDFTLAVDRAGAESIYPHCVIFGASARYAATLAVGDRCSINGRFQSRDYQKAVLGGVETRTAYEIAAGTIQGLKRRESL